MPNIPSVAKVLQLDTTRQVVRDGGHYLAARSGIGLFGLPSMSESAARERTPPPSITPITKAQTLQILSILQDDINSQLLQITEALQDLRESVDRMERIYRIRDVSMDEAMTLTREYLNNIGDKIIYPSEISLALGLDYDLAQDVLNRMERAGEVQKA